jgi:hypothetical protein
MIRPFLPLRFTRWVALGVLLLPFGTASGEPKQEKKDGPQVVVVAPLGVAPGETVKVIIRGVRLDAATEVRFLEPKTSAKVLNKGKDNVPNGQDAALIGDSHIEIEVKLPPDTPNGTVPFLVVTPAGESKAHLLLVERDASVIAEKEPNNGFRQAQPVQVPQLIDGAINPPLDVDVFRIEGKEGQKIVCEVFAARYGSPLDSILTLYDADGHVLASNDDSGGSADSRLELTLPKNGVYFLSLIDAQDLGGPAFVYRLALRVK